LYIVKFRFNKENVIENKLAFNNIKKGLDLFRRAKKIEIFLSLYFRGF